MQHRIRCKFCILNFVGLKHSENLECSKITRDLLKIKIKINFQCLDFKLFL